MSPAQGVPRESTGGGHSGRGGGGRLPDGAAGLAGLRGRRAGRARGAGHADAGRPRVADAGTAGHVLDDDDTYLSGLSHLSAPVAPAALVLGAELEASLSEVLDAFAAGFEAMAVLTAANHPELRARGWHPTAVGGVVGAATAAARLLGLDAERTGHALRLALVQAGGLRAAFGSDGKALQVGLAAAGGVLAARLAAAGATASAEVPAGDGGFEQAFGAHWVDPAGRDAGRTPAVRENWINAYPCCLQTHGAIDAAEQARPAGAATAREIIVAAHPVCLRAASLGPDVADGLQAKFSIPYLAAYTLLRGPPRVESFATVEPDALRLAERVRVRTDPCLLESEALLEVEGEQLGHIEAALGSPARPMDEARLAHKVRQLAGERLDGVLDDRERPAGGVLEAASLC